MIYAIHIKNIFDQITSMKIATGIAAAVTMLALSACQQKPDEKLLGQCWSPGAKSSVQTIATRIITRHIVEAITLADHGKATRADIEQFVKSHLNVTLSNFYLTSADPNTGTVGCGADAAMTFTRADGKVLSGDGASFSFSSFPAEGGSSMYVVPTGLALTQMVDSAVEAAPAPSSSQSAAPASDPTATDDPEEVARNAAAAASAAAASATAATQ